jgi:hypothetical protein
MAEHPGITFKDGPTGRRAGLVLGPDIWEVIKAAREMEERGDAAVPAVAALLNLSAERVGVALRYYAAYAHEIDAEVSFADEESVAAEEAWRAQQRLLA